MTEDSTERGGPEVALRELRERYALATAAGSVGVWDRDLATGTLHLDPAIYALLGFAPDELAPDALWSGRLHPADQVRAWATTRAALAPDAPRDPRGHTPIPETECRLIHRDGGLRWLLARGTVLRRADGTPYRLVGTATDITARKRHELRLAMEYAVTRTLAGEEDLTATAHSVLYHLATGLGYDYAALWLADEGGAVLRCVALRHVAGPPAPALDAASQGATCAPGVDLPGRAWSSDNPVVFPGPDAAARSPRLDAARADGLAVGLAYPARSGRAVVGVLEFYRRDPRTVEEETIAALHALGAQVGQFVARRRANEARRLAEEEARRAEHRYRVLFEQASDPILVGTLEGQILDANVQACQMLGYAREELLGGVGADLLVTGPEAAALRAALRGGTVLRVQRELRRKDGTLVPVEINARALEDGRVLAIARDVSEQLRAEEALRESEARFRPLYEAGIIPIWFWHLDGRVTEANDAYLALVGFSRAELAAGELRWDEITAPEHLDRNRQARAEAVAHGAWAPHETDYVRRDGQRISLLIGGAILPGHRDRGVAFALDLTERKRAEETLRRLTARLLRLQDEEQRRIARELHDVTGQDLFALSILLGRLARPAAGLDERARALVAEARALGEQALRDLRTQAYLLHPPLLDELGLAAALEWFVEGFARRSSIAVELAIDPALGRLPEAIELALFRVVQEGLGNVLRHAGSATARVALAREEDTVALRIEDHGRGLARTAGGDDTSPPTGVGLAGMRERLLPLGGQLAIASSDEGTTLTAVVPLPEEAEPTADVS